MFSQDIHSKETSQQNQVQENEVCEACGTIVELGSVIREDDTQLVLPFSGPTKESVEALADKYIKAAKARFDTVDISVDFKEIESAIESKVTLQFECTAEKLIFEMGLSAI
ncbi:DUF406 family protein [Psychromonas sp. SP041]|uniref:DUF406 family protein n=1 Tax=Psychromonas sp. SP041 TaxID=1365007 RepID=UPI0004189ECE|nr:DUF406 family protein [Psychromonas sp. SP041]